MGSNPILAAIDQRKRRFRSAQSRPRRRLFLPCFYRQHAGPPRTSTAGLAAPPYAALVLPDSVVERGQRDARGGLLHGGDKLCRGLRTDVGDLQGVGDEPADHLVWLDPRHTSKQQQVGPADAGPLPGNRSPARLDPSGPFPADGDPQTLRLIPWLASMRARWRRRRP
jgi:hypothetical protein